MSEPVSRDALPVAFIDPDPDQPRRHFDETALAELAESMNTSGLAEAILVRPVGDRYVIVCGERRWRAAQLNGWSEIPANVRDVAPADVPYLQLAENITRSSLSPVEEARSFRQLLDAGATQQSLADRIGKDRSYVAQKLRLLDLPAHLALLVDRGVLSEGHIRQLLRIRGLYTPRHVIGAVGDGIDYGSWAKVWDGITDLDARNSLVFILLRTCRPEDWPPAYPFGLKVPVDADGLVDAATEARCIQVAAAAESLCIEVADQGHAYPRWALMTYYFSALTVVGEVSVANLDRLIDGWIERIHSALVYSRDIHKNQPQSVSRDTNVHPEPQMRQLLWWGYRSDLRHAGLDLLNEHIGVITAMEKGINDGCYALPSQCQPNGPRHQEYQDLHARLQDLRSGGWSE